MKSVRITRKVDELGRIVIPSEIRKHLDVEPGTDLDVELRGEEVVLIKSQDTCRLCGSDSDLIALDDCYICRSCAKRIKDLA